MPPHIVAGINLNLPLVGTLLRRGGAFFIRRSIRGNMLYSVVLGQYIAQLVSGGYSMAYFVEGGRSRTGRLLPPKRGAVAMTVRAYLAEGLTAMEWTYQAAKARCAAPDRAGGREVSLLTGSRVPKRSSARRGAA